MTQESWDCVSVLLIENRLPEDTPLFVSCSLSCSLYCCCQKHEGWQWWTLSETTRDQHLCSSDSSKFQKAKTKRSTHALYTGRPTFLGLACVFYFLNPSKLHLWSKIHCRLSPITTISNLSCTWSRRSDSRGKLHLFAKDFRILPLRAWQSDRESRDTAWFQLTAFTSAAAKDPYVAPQSDSNEWSN